MSEPLISVIITDYNYGAFISKAINSVFKQTYKNIELVIINDGSTDNSDQVIKRVIENNPERNIKYVSRENRGVVYTRNEGIKIASGKYICFLDADDYFNRDYVSKSYKIAKEHNADVVYPNWHFVGEWLGRPDTDFPEFKPKLLQLQKLHVTPASLIKKSAVGEHKFEAEKVAEDWDFFIGLSLEGVSFKLAKDNYLNYRIRKGTRGSKNNPKEDTKYFVQILEKYKKTYGNKVINPSKLVADRHPHLVKRAFRKAVPNVLQESIKKDGVSVTILKILKKIYVHIKWIRRLTKAYKNYNYMKAIKKPIIETTPGARLAVILHLYYPDTWPLFKSRLANITEPFDLYVTVRQEHIGVDLGSICTNHGKTNVLAVPNRGRDVLPFLIASRIVSSQKQYKFILKLHSKKSLHREDGDKWLSELLGELIPKDDHNVVKILNEKNTGAIGPSKHVVSLKRYIGGNRNHMVHILEKISTREVLDDILLNRDKYPFFGGTMFWCRLDFLDPLISSDLCPADFNPEKKQLDMTTAHAVERIIGMSLHKITKKKMYLVDKKGKVRELPQKVYRSRYRYVD